MNRAITGLVFSSSLMLLTVCCAATAMAESTQPRPGGRETVRAQPATLKLFRSKFTVGTEALALSTIKADAFQQISLACPNSAPSCVLRIDVSSQFFDIVEGQSAEMHALVDGTITGILPSAGVAVSSASGPKANVSTLTFVKNVASGSHRIRVRFKVSSGEANAGFRTMTVSMYTP